MEISILFVLGSLTFASVNSFGVPNFAPKNDNVEGTPVAPPLDPLADVEGSGLVPRETTVDEPPAYRCSPQCGGGGAKSSPGFADEERIVNGTQSVKSRYPFMANLINSNPFYYHFCGGAIFDEKTIITASHCVDGETASDIYVIAGDWNQQAWETSDVWVQAESIIMHQGYDSNSMFNDIAIIKLREALTWRDEIQPICLPSRDAQAGDMCTVIGWGDTEGTGPQDKLREVNVPIISRAQCTNYQWGWYHSSWVQTKQLCAGYPQGMKDSCQGDSGGPLFQKRGGVFELVGVVSWGDGCADPRKPGVYQNVYHYKDWIVNNA